MHTQINVIKERLKIVTLYQDLKTIFSLHIAKIVLQRPAYPTVFPPFFGHQNKSYFQCVSLLVDLSSLYIQQSHTHFLRCVVQEPQQMPGAVGRRKLQGRESRCNKTVLTGWRSQQGHSAQMGESRRVGPGSAQLLHAALNGTDAMMNECFWNFPSDYILDHN